VVSISGYSDKEYVIGNSSRSVLRRIADRLTGTKTGSDSAPKESSISRRDSEPAHRITERLDIPAARVTEDEAISPLSELPGDTVMSELPGSTPSDSKTYDDERLVRFADETAPESGRSSEDDNVRKYHGPESITGYNEVDRPDGYF